MKKYELKVNSLKDLGEVIYNDDNSIDSEKMANEVLTNLVSNLNNVYKFIDKLEDSCSVLDKEVEELLDYVELYQIGDIINLLENVEIKSEKKNTRVCSECNKPMINGYVIDNGMEYYCSDECLHKHYTEEEYLKLYDNGNGDSYYTEWE